jgi:hypothetical protein
MIATAAHKIATMIASTRLRPRSRRRRGVSCGPASSSAAIRPTVLLAPVAVTVATPRTSHHDSARGYVIISDLVGRSHGLFDPRAPL